MQRYRVEYLSGRGAPCVLIARYKPVLASGMFRVLGHPEAGGFERTYYISPDNLLSAELVK